MKNNNFVVEKYEANKFLFAHREDKDLENFLLSFTGVASGLSHSEIWSEVYDFLSEKKYDTKYTTGITYIIES